MIGSKLARRLSGIANDRAPLTRREVVVAAITGLGFAAVFCSPIFTRLSDFNIYGDWDIWFGIQLAAQRSVLQFHQIPLWNPYECGGNPLLGNPQSHFLSPWFAYTLFFGPAVGLHLEVITHNFIAWTGGYVLGRILGIRRLGAAAAAITFAGSSWFYLRAGQGHFHLLSLVYLPWIFTFAIRASDTAKLRYAMISGAILALCFFEGGPYPALYSELAIVAVLLTIAAMRLTMWPIFVIVLVTFFAAGLGAIKLLPAYHVMEAHPRLTYEVWSNTTHALLVSMFSRDQSMVRGAVTEGGWPFWESGAYIGLFVFPAIVGLLSPRRTLPWLVGSALFLILARGWTGPDCLWAWLHRVPFFSSTRLPSRFLVPLVLMAGVIAGIGIDLICSAGLIPLVSASVFIFLATADLWIVGSSNLKQQTLFSPGQPQPQFSQFRRPLGSETSPVAQLNYGVVNCYEYVPWPTPVSAQQDANYRGEQYMLGHGAVTLLNWTPNVLTYRIKTRSVTTLVINQNYDHSWRIIEGKGMVVDQGGLLAILVPAGEERLTIAYRDRYALFGGLISLATVILAVLLSVKMPAVQKPPPCTSATHHIA